MSEQDLEKLLGGFAADTLTPEEKQALYHAALQDQQLFNVLADEQALKELLSDPDVRRRLLASLDQEHTADVRGSLSWLDWFRRPAGLALAGGLSAAALALVLGVRIYQDSLKQAPQAVATEEVRPAAPQAVAPLAKAKENLAPVIDFDKKDRLADKPTKEEQSPPPPLKKDHASDSARESKKQRREQDETHRQAEAPVAAPSISTDEMASSGDQKLAASAASPSSMPELKHMQTPASGRLAATVGSTLSARALFYGGGPSRTDTRSTAKEQEQAMKTLDKSPLQASQPGRPLEGLSHVGKTAATAAQLRPLGLRYSFVVRETDGQDQEVDAAAASMSTQPVFLTVEVNQDAYIQIWKIVGSSRPQLLWPQKETGQSSLKIAAGQRQLIPLATENQPITLTARVSRVSSGLIAEPEAALLDRLSPNQLQESITPSGAEKSPERATYVLNQDPSIAQLTVDMILDR